MQYPKYLYHKSEAPKLVQSKEEHDALGKGWEETPAAFDQKQDEAPEKPETGSEETGFESLSVKELQKLLIEKGIDPKGLKKPELIALLKGE